jgi:hypothetical protein
MKERGGAYLRPPRCPGASPSWSGIRRSRPPKGDDNRRGRAPARSQGVQHAGIIGDIAGLAVSVIGLSDCPHESGSEPNFPLFLVPRMFGMFGKFDPGLQASQGMRKRRLHRPFD